MTLLMCPYASMSPQRNSRRTRVNSPVSSGFTSWNAIALSCHLCYENHSINIVGLRTVSVRFRTLTRTIAASVSCTDRCDTRIHSMEVQMEENVSELMQVLNLETVDGPAPGGEAHCFKAWNQKKPGGRLFGGQVLAQCVAATSQTMSEDRFIHSIHGYFCAPDAMTRTCSWASRTCATEDHFRLVACRPIKMGCPFSRRSRRSKPNRTVLNTQTRSLMTFLVLKNCRI